MVAKLRLLTALCALVAAMVVVSNTSPPPSAAPLRVQATDIPMTNVTTTIKWPVIETTDPSPFNPCKDIPFDALQKLGLFFTPPVPEEQLRCKFDAGNYQLSVEAIVWRTYAETLPTDAVELDIDGHRAAQWWIMKPTDWNNRWWVTCMIAFDTDYGVLQQALFYSPIYSNPTPDCMQTNLQRAHDLMPYYKF
jgi:hypothetical protein